MPHEQLAIGTQLHIRTRLGDRQSFPSNPRHHDPETTFSPCLIKQVMEFTYSSPVRAEELRLLKPIQINHSALFFTITKGHRRSAPPYTAVSYVWGNDKASEHIFLDGRRFPVRPNLWSCLYYLGENARGGPWTYLWVDAICIDQSNDAERNVQVRLMDETYHNAACVSVWLGLPTIPRDMMMRSPDPGLPPARIIEMESFDWGDAIVGLANRPYWSRFWVVQEFLLAQQLVLHCGNSQMSWDNFRDMLCYETGVDLTDPDFGAPGHTLNTAAALSYRALPLVMNRHVDKFPEYLQPLYDLLVQHRRSQSTDPRDRVFALLGLVTHEERAFLERFFPDYSMLEDVVRVIALAHVVHFPRTSTQPEEGITVDSEELFQGLGVRSKSERRRLLRRAEDFDYLEDWDPGQVAEYFLQEHV
ncbi:HET-domain-containing protein [Parathielavia hyrcaniae]|uniref:HET-domain-containing protein n=1 Tax=Parathielavia hyrcaniae TaxID=113614 RepID=A0AAN6PWG9_9PEZI|nr:HET-domain-containing protein [Parathielavia hyrcaniae]